MSTGTRTSTTEGAPGERAEPEGRVEAERFEVIREIGQGGMATIYLASDRQQPERPAALKVIHPHLATDPQLVERFKHEVRAHVGLEHPGIVRMLGWGRDRRERLFMAMEYVDGPTLKQLMQARPRFPVDVVVFLLARLLEGLQAAHRGGVIHRDLKPANVMLSLDGQPKLGDFGISKAADMTRLTTTGSVVGTPAYMSPEQAHGLSLDARSDLFSVGILLHELLLGSNPFHSDNPAVTLQRVITHRVRPLFETLPQTPVRIEALLENLLAKSPTDRTPDTAAALDELAACAQEEHLASTQTVMREFLAEPDKVARQLNARRAQRCHERGMQVYAAGRGSAEGAIWEFFLATLLDPNHADARNWLEQLSNEQGYNLRKSSNARIEELEAKLKQEPDQLHVVMQLAKLHKVQGNFLQVIFYYKRARALRPPDQYTQNQIDTLVHPQAASVIDGTGMFETVDGVPVRTRPVTPPVEAPRAASWGEFLAGLWSTIWARVAAVALSLGVVILMAGAVLDQAARPPARPAGSAESLLPEGIPGDPQADAAVAHVRQAERLTERGDHAAAEARYRSFLERYPDSQLTSSVLFRLADSLERQGRRPEAIDVHAECAAEGSDRWSIDSLERMAELHLVDGDLQRARLAYEDMGAAATGERRLAALAGVAEVELAEGDARSAVYAFQELLPLTEETALDARVRLGLADARAVQGEADLAAELYEEVRETTDHLSEEHGRAREALDRLDR